jgi:hypothetical protein
VYFVFPEGNPRYTFIETLKTKLKASDYNEEPLPNRSIIFYIVDASQISRALLQRAAKYYANCNPTQ